MNPLHERLRRAAAEIAQMAWGQRLFTQTDMLAWAALFGEAASALDPCGCGKQVAGVHYERGDDEGPP